MQQDVRTYAPQTMTSEEMESMFRLRYEIFHEKLGWNVQHQNGMERDPYDDVERVAYVLAKSANGAVDACWRLLPTTGPNMLRDTFPELLHGLPAPHSEKIWEMSRFAVATSRADTANGAFGPISKALMRESAAFAAAHGIERYVTVTTPVMERMLRQQGLHIHRMGPSIRIGIAAAVAVVIEVDHLTLDAVGYTGDRIMPSQSH